MLHPSHKEIGENEFVETLGLEFDAVEPGLIIEHRPGFTFSWTEARYRALLAGDHAPVYVDPALSAASGGGSAVFAPTWIIAIFAAATTRAFGRVVANLAWENVVFPHPLRDGDTVFAESEILGKRRSNSRENQGVLHVRTSGCRPDGLEICRYERKFLLYLSAERPHLESGYV